MTSMLQIKEAVRMMRRTRHVRRKGFREYDGDAEEICESIIEDCFDAKRKYFRTSNGNFCEFYMRDFAFCCEALVSLGYVQEVEETLRYALERFRIHESVEGAISPDGVPFTFPSYAPDSLALLLYSLTHTKNRRLAVEYKSFLQSQINIFARKVVDQRSLLPYAHKQFSSIRDHALRKASCYDAVMIAVVAREAKALELKFPHEEQEVVAALVKTYWNGTYFFADSTKQDIVVGDANVFPFWTSIITDTAMRENALNAMHAAGLDDPFPLRYVSKHDKKRERVGLHIANLFARDYETDSIWMHLGLAYLRVLAEQDPETCRTHLAQYTKKIERHKTFLEIYDSQGEPFRRRFYVTDEGMLWCANYLALQRELAPGNSPESNPSSESDGKV